jgi:hypothetical protein
LTTAGIPYLPQIVKLSVPCFQIPRQSNNLREHTAVKEVKGFERLKRLFHLPVNGLNYENQFQLCCALEESGCSSVEDFAADFGEETIRDWDEIYPIVRLLKVLAEILLRR